MSVLNSATARRLANHSPRQIFMGLPATDPFCCLYAPSLQTISSIPITVQEINESFEQLRAALDDMHVVADFSKAAERRIRNRSFIKTHLLGKHRKKAYNLDETRALPSDELEYSELYSLDEAVKLDASFSVGDFVLVAIPIDRLTSKLQCRWTGPYQITKMLGPRLVEVEHLITKEKSEYHVIRIKFYADKELGMEQEILDELTWEAAFDHSFEVERIISYRYDPELQMYTVLVKWKGFSELQNSYEPLRYINESAPSIVNEFILTLSESQQHLLLRAISDTQDAASVTTDRSSINYRFKLGDVVLVRGTYWKKGGIVPQFYRGVIAGQQPEPDVEGQLLWSVTFDDGTFQVHESELARSISELIRLQQLAPDMPSEKPVDDPKRNKR